MKTYKDNYPKTVVAIDETVHAELKRTCRQLRVPIYAYVTELIKRDLAKLTEKK